MEQRESTSLSLIGLLALILVFTCVMTLIVMRFAHTTPESHMAWTEQPPLTESDHEKPNDSSWEVTD